MSLPLIMIRYFYKKSLENFIKDHGFQGLLKESINTPEYLSKLSYLRLKFPTEIAKLEYWVNHPPYSRTSRFLGNLDNLIRIEKKKFALRGWLIPEFDKIKELNIIYNERNYPILAHKLPREDVYKNFYFLPNSRLSGFTGILEDIEADKKEINLQAEIKMFDGKTFSAEFQPIEISDLY